MAVKVVVSKEARPGVVEVTGAEKVRLEARLAFRDFANCWFNFAKALSVVKAEEVWKELGHENFKEYCSEEFPTVPYSTVCKFVAVVESWGSALEQKMLKAPEEPLPSYDACYEVAAVEDKIPKEELPKLRKSILERSISRIEVRERLRSLRSGRSSGLKKTERERLNKALKESDKKAKAEAKAITEDLVNVKDTKADSQAQDLLARAKLLFDNIDPLTKKLTEASPQVIELAEYLRDNFEAFSKAVDGFLTRVEEISNEE